MAVVGIVPILKVTHIEMALPFYCNRLGFRRCSLFQRQPGEPAYAVLEKDTYQIHLSSFSGDGVGGACVYIEVDDIDALHKDLLERGWQYGEVDILEQDWGRREIYINDGDGNTLRFGAG